MPKSDEFDLSSVDALDEASLNIRHPKSKKPTGWIWTFFGPAHPATLQVADKVGREALRRANEIRLARINGKEWTDDNERSLEQIRLENVEAIVARTKTFSPVRLEGKLIEFSSDNARELLLDRRKGWLLADVMEFLGSEQSFIQPSATS